VYIEQARAMLSEEAPGLPASTPAPDPTLQIAQAGMPGAQAQAQAQAMESYEPGIAGLATQLPPQPEKQPATAGAEMEAGARAEAKKNKTENGGSAYRQLSLFDT
jgi:uncharacterized protein involved in copper resistance